MKTLVFGLLCFLTFSVSAQSNLSEGQTLFKKSLYKEALPHFQYLCSTTLREQEADVFNEARQKLMLC